MPIATGGGSKRPKKVKKDVVPAPFTPGRVPTANRKLVDRADRKNVVRALQSPNSPAGVAKKSRSSRPVVASRVIGRANAATRGKGQKLGLKKQLAKNTGTTVGEAKGVMQIVRRKVRAGNTTQAQRYLSKKLAGGPRAGIKKTAASATAASRRSQKVVGKIQTKQAQRKRKKVR